MKLIVFFNYRFTPDTHTDFLVGNEQQDMQWQSLYRMAPASYSRTEASNLLFSALSIISLEIAVIAIKSGSVIGILLECVKYTYHS